MPATADQADTVVTVDASDLGTALRADSRQGNHPDLPDPTDADGLGLGLTDIERSKTRRRITRVARQPQPAAARAKRMVARLERVGRRLIGPIGEMIAPQV